MRLQAKTLPQVDPTKIVAIGYCFGGMSVIQLLRAWPDAGVANLLGELLAVIVPYLAWSPTNLGVLALFQEEG